MISGDKFQRFSALTDFIFSQKELKSVGKLKKEKPTFCEIKKGNNDC